MSKEPKIKSQLRLYHGNVKCDCGHTSKDHYLREGACHDSSHKSPGKCGCTWFYPNVKYIGRLRNEKDLREKVKLIAKENKIRHKALTKRLTTIIEELNGNNFSKEKLKKLKKKLKTNELHSSGR